MERRAKIVATVGPASSDSRILARLLKAGVDIVRLNFSHGEAEEHRAIIRRVREVADAQGRFVGVLADLMGPRYRLGPLAERLELRRGQTVRLGTGDAELPVSGRTVLKYLAPGERILIDNGLVELRAVARRGDGVEAEVLVGGSVSSRKGINLPDSDLPFRVSAKDRRDIELAVEEEVDFVAASYVGSARDVAAVRRAVQRAGGEIPLVAKLERQRAVDPLDTLEEIIQESDAVMVARGDLGVEVPLHRVPTLQKRMIETSWRLGRPVIVATQMLESMMNNPRPTRAESSDVANAVFDGADALMLSGETAAGQYPLEAVRTMVRVIQEAEEHQAGSADEQTDLRSGLRGGPFDIEPPARPGTLEIPETISAAAVLSSRQLGAKRIVALTQGGFTARMLASRRPSTPIVALTQSRQAARRLQLVWGVRPVLMTEEVDHHDEVVQRVDERLLQEGLAKPGDRIAILMGDPIRDRPPTNLLRLHRVRAKDGSGRRGT